MAICTVIVPTYNAKNFIQQTLDSIYCQTFKNFKVVIIDDASCDGTSKILDGYKKNFPAQTEIVLNDFNKGVGYTLFKSIQGTSSPYICLMGHDDVWESNFLESQLDALEKNSLALASFANVEFIGDNDRFHSYQDLFRHSILNENRQQVFLELLKGNFLCAPSAVVRNSQALHLYLGYCNDRLQDYELWLFLLLKGELIYNKSAHMMYRVHAQNMSLSLNKYDFGPIDFACTINRLLFSSEFRNFIIDLDNQIQFLAMMSENLRIVSGYSPYVRATLLSCLQSLCAHIPTLDSQEMGYIIGQVYGDFFHLTKQFKVSNGVFHNYVRLYFPTTQSPLAQELKRITGCFDILPWSEYKYDPHDRFSICIIEPYTERKLSTNTSLYTLIQKGRYVSLGDFEADNYTFNKKGSVPTFSFNLNDSMHVLKFANDLLSIIETERHLNESNSLFEMKSNTLKVYGKFKIFSLSFIHFSVETLSEVFVDGHLESFIRLEKNKISFPRGVNVQESLTICFKDSFSLNADVLLVINEHFYNITSSELSHGRAVGVLERSVIRPSALVNSKPMISSLEHSTVFSNSTARKIIEKVLQAGLHENHRYLKNLELLESCLEKQNEDSVLAHAKYCLEDDYILKQINNLPNNNLLYHLLLMKMKLRHYPVVFKCLRFLKKLTLHNINKLRYLQ